MWTIKVLGKNLQLPEYIATVIDGNMNVFGNYNNDNPYKPLTELQKGQSYLCDARCISKQLQPGFEYRVNGAWVDYYKDGKFTLHITKVISITGELSPVSGVEHTNTPEV